MVSNKQKELRKYLENERNRLSDELQKKTSPELDTQRSPYGKREAASMGSSELEKGQSMVRRLKEQLAEVEHALEKLDDGTYGICDNCGKSIPPERLEAIPQTSLCLDCKAKQER